ncbi:hypothetical protein ACTWPB_22325 [Nocardia sp. IBHARD005]|uniref:hypothetical protein n=1 Tax=Nocardia sp. IBHARD005 TaxID=3457765 RepID=UPI0040585B47
MPDNESDLLMQVARSLRRRWAAVYAPMGLTPHQARVGSPRPCWLPGGLDRAATRGAWEQDRFMRVLVSAGPTVGAAATRLTHAA